MIRTNKLRAYKTIAHSAVCEHDVNKSRFIANISRTDSEISAVEYTESIKRKYRDARHNCSAYIIGADGRQQKFDDDGEPGGTAGKPILNVLQHKAIGNCAILVVRYFGGIKLGAGGLTRAYSGTAQAVVDNMTLAEFVPMTQIDVETDFANESFVRHQVNSIQGNVLSTEYDKQVKLTISLAENSLAEFKEKLGFYGKILPNDQTN